MSRKQAKITPKKENLATGLLGGKSGGNGHIGVLGDPDFRNLLFRLLKFRLTGREIKYLLWRFYYRMDDMQIARFDERCKDRQGINIVIQGAYAKIKHDIEKL